MASDSAVSTVTPETKRIAADLKLTLTSCVLQSGVDYLRVFRGETCLGEIWEYDKGGSSRWRVLPDRAPKKYRAYAESQAAALALLVARYDAFTAAPVGPCKRRSEHKETAVAWSTQQRVQDLIRHITLVRNACVLMGTRLIERGEIEDGLEIIECGHRHDQSKWRGIERDYLHIGPDVDKDRLALAMRQHTATNDHHPEFWAGGIHSMSRAAVAEMVCDWYARSQERGTGLRQWITEQAMSKFHFKPSDSVCKTITEFVDLLLQDPFAKVDQ